MCYVISWGPPEHHTTCNGLPRAGFVVTVKPQCRSKLVRLRMAGVAVATVRAEEATAVPPETVAVAIASGTIIVRGIVVPVNS